MLSLMCVLGLALIPMTIEAQQSPSPEMTVTALSLDGMIKLVQGMGFQCTRDKGGQFFTFQAEGYKVAPSSTIRTPTLSYTQASRTSNPRSSR